MPRTGTSTIQGNLVLNENVLTRLGFWYPATGREFNAHHSWAAAMTVPRQANFLPDQLPQCDLEKEIERFQDSKEAHTLILSSEGFFSAQSVKPIFRSLTQSFNVHLIAILRHPIDFIDSFLNQRIKMSAYSQWAMPENKIEWRDFAPRLYSETLGVFMNGLDNYKLTILPYGHGVNSWNTFCMLLGCSTENLDFVTSPHNISLRPEALCLIRDMQHQISTWSQTESAALVSMLEEYSLEFHEHEPFTLLLEADRQKIIERYQGDLGRIELDFFEDGQLFPPPSPKPYFNIYDPPIIDMSRMYRHALSKFINYSAHLYEKINVTH